MWFTLTIFGAFLTASQYALIKSSIGKIDKYVLAAGIFLSAAVMMAIATIFVGIPEIKPEFYFAVCTTVAINFVATILYYNALKITDLSLADPITSFTPVFLILTSFLILGELPSRLGSLGIILIVIGAYVLNLRKNGDNKYEKSLGKILKNKGVLYMLAVAFLYSISSNYDKLTVANSSPVFGSAAIYISLGLLFLIVAMRKNRDTATIFKKQVGWFLLIGVVVALSAIAVNAALLMQIVPYVISIKRTSILFSVLFGAFIFKEKNFKERMAGALIMLAGMVIIYLYK